MQLEERTKRFALNIIHFATLFPTTPEFNVIRYQITKSGTSIGANYREANRSRSKPDFINKINMCAGEANETVYWLELIEGIEGWENLKKEIKPLLKEGKEILAIFTSVSHNMKKRQLKT